MRNLNGGEDSPCDPHLAWYLYSNLESRFALFSGCQPSLCLKSGRVSCLVISQVLLVSCPGWRFSNRTDGPRTKWDSLYSVPPDNQTKFIYSSFGQKCPPGGQDVPRIVCHISHPRRAIRQLITCTCAGMESFLFDSSLQLAYHWTTDWCLGRWDVYCTLGTYIGILFANYPIRQLLMCPKSYMYTYCLLYKHWP